MCPPEAIGYCIFIIRKLCLNDALEHIVRYLKDFSSQSGLIEYRRRGGCNPLGGSGCLRLKH